MGAKLHIKTIGKLGKWKYFLWARAFVDLAKYEIADHRVEGSLLNCNHALDKEHEGKPLAVILGLPPSALQGLAEHSNADFAKFHIHTIEQLGTWKYAVAANAITTLAELETPTLSQHR